MKKPTIKIRPEQSHSRVTETWQYRELIVFLIWRDLKIRYKQTFLGVLWVVLNPLMMSIVFTIFLGRLIKIPSDNVPYPLFVYSGLAVWTFFSNTVLVSSDVIRSSGYLITKIYFPHIVLPISTVGVRLIDFLISFSVIFVLMLFYGSNLNINLLLLPLFIAEVVAITLSISIILSAFCARFRDFGAVLPVVLQIFMFVSPVVYSASLIPEKWQRVYSLNPFVGIINGIRGSLFGLEFEWESIAISLVVTIVISGISLFIFQRLDRNLVDIV